ncbi:hypothetical protein BV25DRAFT_1990290, partial [Artomyces pyxidatus]
MIITEPTPHSSEPPRTPIDSSSRFEYPFPDPSQSTDIPESLPFSSAEILPPFSPISKLSPPLTTTFKFIRPPPTPIARPSISFHYTSSPPTS